MVTINLLPWREWKAAYEVRVIKQMMVSIFLAHVVIVLGGYLLITEINREWKTEVAHLSQQVKRKNNWQHQVIADTNPNPNIKNVLPMSLPDQLSPYEVFQLFQTNRPQTLCFTEVKRHKKNWMIVGKTQKLYDLMLYLKAWYNTSLFSSIHISDLNQGPYGFQFRLFVMEKNNTSQ
jgi:hypothetical protein